jgi:serine acetyltransferase
LNIGHGSVIAAGSVVTKDIPPFMIVAGVPAVPIRKRFEDDIADRLTALAWWDWNHEALRTALPDFRSLPIEAFLEKYEDE